MFEQDLDILIKGKVAQEGEVRTWANGRKYKKINGKWVEVSAGPSKGKQSETSAKKAKSNESQQSTDESDDQKQQTAIKQIIKGKVALKKFKAQNQELFDTGEHAHPDRSKVAKFIRGKAKGLAKGLKHEVIHVKDAGQAIGVLFSGKKPSAHQMKSLKKVGITLGLTVGSMILTGGIGGLFAKGGVVFMKSIAVHFIEHVVAESTILATIFAKAENGEEVSEQQLEKLILAFAQYIESGDWSNMKPSDDNIQKSQYQNEFKLLGL